MCHLTFCLSQFYLTLLVAKYLKMKFKKEQVASIDCIYQEDINISLRLPTNFGKSVTTAYQTFYVNHVNR